MAQIHWLRALNGAFNTAADWSAGVVPGAGDDAILDAAGAAFTVSATQNVTVNSVQTASNGLLDIQANFSATNGTGAGANDGAIRIENGHTLTLQGTVTNAGSIELFGTVSPTSIVLGSGGVTLDGGGAIFLNFTGGALQQIVPSASGSILTDVDNRISGQGLLGGPGLTIIVEAQGFLEAKAGPLIINTGANTIINAGLIDAEGAPGSDGLPPGLGTVESPVNNSGIVESGGIGSILTFQAAVTGTGRAIVHDGTLRFGAFFAQDVDFEGSTGVLALAQSANYTGLIAQFATTGGESFDLGDIGFVGAGEATYSGTTGGGTLTVTDGTHTAHIHLEGNYLSEVFVASGDGHGGTSVTDSPKSLHWLNAVNGSFQTGADWTGGVVPGPGADAILDASGSPYAVTASASQSVAGVQTATNATLSVGGAFAATKGSDGGLNAGRILIVSGGIVTLGGTLGNTGVINLGASTGRATLMASGALTLTGGGEVFLGDNAGNIIVGSSPSATLTNVQNTIAGAGDLGAGELTLVNGAGGKIEAEGQSTPLLIDTGANTIVNAGLIEATGGGGLFILSAVNNAGGGVIAAAGGKVFLEGANILGGTLRSSGGTAIYVASGADTFDGTTSAVNIQGEVVVENGQTLNLVGAFNNTGLIELSGNGAATTLAVGAAGATLNSAGQVFMGNGADEIIGTNSTSTLTNTANVIGGTGELGGGRMTLINGTAGLIAGEGWTAALIVDTGVNTILNAGRIENTGKGGTLVKSAVANSGVLIAQAGTLTLEGAVTGSGAAVIYAGTMAFASSFSQTVVFRGTGGVLGLAQSQGFAATISGFSTTGGTSLDLGDITFKSTGEATYSGTATSGVLTVTDGVHTAHIHLSGNYLGSVWTASSDGHGGTIIVDPPATPSNSQAPTHRFIAAMAVLQTSSGCAIHYSQAAPARELMLATPASWARLRTL